MSEKWVRDRRVAIFRENLGASTALPPYVIGLLLAGCGGGGGGAAPTTLTASVSGLVFDGPVRGATVWLDTNLNNRIDPDDDIRVGVTGADGRYSYSLQLPAEHVSGGRPNKPLIVDLTGARDIEAPNTPLAGTWRAPVGSTIISPLTEFIVATEKTPLELAEMLNLPESVDVRHFNPYSEQDSEDSRKVLVAGQVVAAEIVSMQNGGGASVAFSPEFIEALPNMVDERLPPNFDVPTGKSIVKRAGDTIVYYLNATDPDEGDMLEFVFPDIGMIQSGAVTYDSGNILATSDYGTATAPTVIGTLRFVGNALSASPKFAGLIFTPNEAAFDNLALGTSESFTVRIEARDDSELSPHATQDVTFTIARFTPVEVRHSFSRSTDNEDIITEENTTTRITLAEQPGDGGDIRLGRFRAWLPDDNRLNEPDIFNERNELIKPSDGVFGETGNAMTYIDENDNGMLDDDDTVHNLAPGGVAFWRNTPSHFGGWQYGINPFKLLGAGKDLIHVVPVAFDPADSIDYAPPEMDVRLIFIIERGDAVVDEGGTHTISMSELNNEGATYTITTAPSHGTLFRDGEALDVDDTFTQADIQTVIDDNPINLISYEHDGSETTTDNFDYELGDGTTGSFDFAVSPVNDVM